MQLEGLKLEPGIKIEAPLPPPPPYYIRTFGNNLASPIGQVLLIGTTALAYDTTDNLYATGLGYTTVMGNQGVTVKFNVDTTVGWQKFLSTESTSDYTFLYSASVDNSNNLYVTGVVTKNWQDATKSPTFQIAKYNSSGTILWQRDLGYGFSTFVPNFGTGVVVEKSTGDIYMAGDVLNGTLGSQTTDMTIVKYDASGAIQWAKEIGTSGTNDHCNAVELDSTGNVYIAGSTTYSGQNSAALVKYNPSGTLLWQRALSGTTSGNPDQFNCITLDSSNNIFVCGNTYTTLNVGIIAKYNSAGTLLWQRQIFSGDFAVLLYGISVDNVGNVYAVGVKNSQGLIVKYDTSGNLQWQRNLTASSTSGSMNINLSSITFDSADIMTIGGDVNQSTDSNMLIIKLPSDGTLLGTYEVNGIDIVYTEDNLTDSALTFTPVTPNMNSATVNYIDAGPSTLTESTSSFVNTVTPIL
jgi:hypothetical protein